MSRIKMFFRWAVENELVPSSVHFSPVVGVDMATRPVHPLLPQYEVDLP